MSFSQEVLRIIEDALAKLQQQGIPGSWLTGQVPGNVVAPATSSSAGAVTLSDDPPADLGTADPGSASDVSRSDHVHGHGDQPGGSLHALATDTDAGFVPPANGSEGDVLTQVSGAWQPQPPSGGGGLPLPVGADGTYVRSNGSTASWSAIQAGDLPAINLASGVTGTLPIANGGTGQTTATAAFAALSPLTIRGDLLTRDASGHKRLPLAGAGTYLRSDGTDVTWDSLQEADLPSINLATTAVFIGSLPVNHGGTGASTATAGFNNLAPTTTRGDLIVRGAINNQRLALGATGRYLVSDGTDAIWNVLDMTNAAAGTLVAARGGTGFSSYTVGDLLFAGTTSSLSALADVATGNALISGGVSTAPSWGKIGLSTHVSGTLPLANGGTAVNGSSAAPTFFGLNLGSGSGAGSGEVQSVYSSTGAGSWLVKNSNTGSGAYTWIRVGNDTGNDAGLLRSSNANTGYTGAGNELVLITGSAHNIGIVTNNSLRMRFSSAGAIGFFGSNGTTQPTITGAKGGNVALTNLLTALANMGLLVNSTT